MCKIETCAVSASSVSGSARSWTSFGQVYGSTAAGSHDPGLFEEGRSTKRRLETFSYPDDEHDQSAVLSQCHAVSAWLKETLATADMFAADMPVRVHCKTGATSVRLVFSTMTQMPRVCGKDDGVDSSFVTQCHHCCSPIQVIRRPKNQKRFFSALGGSVSRITRTFSRHRLMYEHKSSATGL